MSDIPRVGPDRKCPRCGAKCGVETYLCEPDPPVDRGCWGEWLAYRNELGGRDHPEGNPAQYLAFLSTTRKRTKTATKRPKRTYTLPPGFSWETYKNGKA